MAARRRRRAGLTCCYGTAPGMRETRLLSNRLGCRTRRFVAVVSALGGIQLLATMDGTVAIFALPKIQNDLGLSDATRSWVITAYVLAFGGLLLLGGRIGDTIGHKRTLIVGAALFTITSAMCGIAWDGGVLVVARLLKGVAAAIVTPTSMALVATMFPKGPARNTAMVGVRRDGQLSGRWWAWWRAERSPRYPGGWRFW